MKKDEKFIPVVSLAIYYGNEETKWDAACNLHELIDWKTGTEIWKPYINDYHLHVLDYHSLEDFSIFHSEMKQVLQFLKCASDKDGLKRLFTEHGDEYYNVGEDTYRFIAQISHSKELIENEKHARRGDGEYNMCKGLSDWMEESRSEGKIDGKTDGIKIIRGMLINNFDVSTIAKLSSLEEAYIRDIAITIEEHPEWTDLQIAKKLVLQEA